MQLVEKMNPVYQAEIDAFVAMQNSRDDVLGYAKSGCAFNVSYGNGGIASVRLFVSAHENLWLEVQLSKQGVKSSSRVSDRPLEEWPDVLNGLFFSVNNIVRELNGVVF